MIPQLPPVAMACMCTTLARWATASETQSAHTMNGQQSSRTFTNSAPDTQQRVHATCQLTSWCTLQEAAKEHDSCTNNLHNSLAELGLKLADDHRFNYYTPQPLNLWQIMSDEPDETGFIYAPPHPEQKAGDYCVFSAEVRPGLPIEPARLRAICLLWAPACRCCWLPIAPVEVNSTCDAHKTQECEAGVRPQADCVAVMSACPWDVSNMNGPGGEPRDCHFQVFPA